MHLQIGTLCAECSVLKPKKVFNRYEIVANSSGRPSLYHHSPKMIFWTLHEGSFKLKCLWVGVVVKLKS